MGRITTATVVVAAIVVATAGSATADVVAISDRRGDAPARYDITRVRVSNSSDRLVVKTHVRDLEGDRTQIYGFTAIGGDGSSSYMITTIRRPSGKTTGHISAYVDGSAANVSCKLDRRWSTRRNTIEVSIRRDCIAAGALRIIAYIGAGNGQAGDPADVTEPATVQQG